MPSEVPDLLVQIVCRHLSVEPPLVSRDAALVHDLGADSLDITELIMAIEEAFDIEITDEDAVGLRTVADVATLIANKRKAAEPTAGL